MRQADHPPRQPNLTSHLHSTPSIHTRCQVYHYYYQVRPCMQHGGGEPTCSKTNIQVTDLCTSCSTVSYLWVCKQQTFSHLWGCKYMYEPRQEGINPLYTLVPSHQKPTHTHTPTSKTYTHSYLHIEKELVWFGLIVKLSLSWRE